MEENIRLKRSRQLDKEYVIVYCIKNKIKVKCDDKIIDKNLYTFMGLNLLGERIIMDIKIEREQDNHFWLDIFEAWRNRGVNDIYMFSMEENNNLQRAMRIIFPNGKIVPSMQIIITSIYRYVGGYRHGRNSFIKLLKHPLIQENIEEGKNKLEVFKEAYKNNLVVSKLIENKLNNLDIYYNEYDIVVRELILYHTKTMEIYDRINTLIEINGYITNNDEVWNYLYDYIKYIEKFRTYTKNKWTIVLEHVNTYFPKVLESIIS